MQRLLALDRYQKGILMLLILMVAVFSVAYPVVTSRVGMEYMDSILCPAEENGSTVYSGKIDGQQASFTVSPEKSVTFRIGDRVYGPYTAVEDPTAVPEDHPWAADMTGVEIRRGETIVFRGGYLPTGTFYTLHREDGTSQMQMTVVYSDGTTFHLDGSPTDPMEPSPEAIFRILKGPKLTHKGDWQGWFLGTLISVATAVSILFADELFRWNLAFQIRNTDGAEPSDWEIASRYIGWTLLPILALMVYCMGLN